MDFSHFSILHVADYVMPSMGYQEFLLAKWNARHGHRVHIVTSDRYAPVPDYDNTWGRLLGPRIVGAGIQEVDGVVIHRLKPLFELKRRMWFRGLARKLVDIGPDAVLYHGTSSPLAFGLAFLCHRLGIPLFMDNHMAFVAQRRDIVGRWYYAALRLATRTLLNPRVRLFLGVSGESCQFMVQEQAVDPSKVRLLEIGVDTEVFTPDPDAGRRTREAHGIPEDALVVLQTGKLTPDKSPHWLSQAMAPLMAADRRVRLVFLGGGPREYVEEVKRPLMEAGVLDRTHFLPPVPVGELGHFYNMADLCVFPDASSLSAVEAAACGRTVVVTDLPWGQERREAGLVFTYRRGDIADLRGRVRALLYDDEARRAQGLRARDAALRKYSYDAIARRLEDLMRQAIAQK